MKTIVYVDGFNLYYGAVKNTPYKWLNISQMCQLLLPNHTIVRIKYFTARVSGRPNDPNQPTRQQTFLRALGTLPNFDIIYGHFLSNEVTMPLTGCPPNAQKYAKVIKTEEKGSDVNLATHLLRDGYLNLYETAVLVTNDSDLVEPVRIVRQELQRDVGILNPHLHPSKVLQRFASFIKPIRAGVLAASQFPPQLKDMTVAGSDDPILEQSLQCLVWHRHPEWGDRHDLDVFNRLLAKSIKPIGWTQNTHLNVQKHQIKSRREHWRVEALAQLDLGHRRTSGEDFECPIVVAEYEGRLRVLDGNHRINRWIEIRDAGRHQVNIHFVEGSCEFIELAGIPIT